MVLLSYNMIKYCLKFEYKKFQILKRNISSTNNLKKVVLIGRANVGKSSLFNKLTFKNEYNPEKRVQLVHNKPGTTRDSISLIAKLGNDIQFQLTDTSGLEKNLNKNNKTWQKQAEAITKHHIQQADIIWFMYDIQVGITYEDLYFAKWLKKILNKKKLPKMLVIANKCENIEYPNIQDAYQLKCGKDIISLSAIHNIGYEQLYHYMLKNHQSIIKVNPAAVNETKKKISKDNKEQKISEKKKKISVAVIGQPNVGKSTLINKLFDSINQPKQTITSSIPNLTRDSIYLPWLNDITLIDTAGLTKKSLKYDQDGLLALSQDETYNAIHYSHITLLVFDIYKNLNHFIDINQANEKRLNKNEFMELCRSKCQDILSLEELSIARHVINEGRSLILIANKVDQLGANDQFTGSGNDQQKFLISAILLGLKDMLTQNLSQIPQIEIQTISSLYDPSQLLQHQISSSIDKVYHKWNKRISTSRLNQWLNQIVKYYPIPKGNKIRYISQVSIRPPRFVLFGTYQAKNQMKRYVKFLTNMLRKEFDLNGVSVRIFLRSAYNPYAYKSKKGSK